MGELSGLFDPDRVAVIGASPREGSIGRALTANLLADFAGEVVPVNPNHDSVLGVPCVPGIGDAEGVDLAVVAVPAPVVPNVLREAGEAGVGNVVVISAGFAEADEEGAKLERELQGVADEYGLTLVGPNSLGIISTPAGLNATFANANAEPGSISMLSQSGAFVTATLDWASERGIGFRDVVSLGNQAVVDETDVLEHWGSDPGTDVIVGYLEGIDEGRAFVDRVRRVTDGTPVLLVKSGRTTAGARAAASHTGTMAGSDRAYTAGFRQAGVLRPDSVEGLFDGAATLAGQPLPSGDGVGVVTNAGGPGVLTSDALASSELSLAELTDRTVAELSSVLPSRADVGNPVDVVGDADVDRFRRALDVVVDDPNVHAVVVLSAPTAIFDFDELAGAVLESLSGRDLPLVTCLMGGARVDAAASRLREHGVPNFFDPARAVRGLDALARYRTVRAREYAEPLQYAFDDDRLEERLAAADGRDGRISVEGMDALDALGISRPQGGLAGTPAEAAEIAGEVGGPVVLKVASPDVFHKSDVGGVEVGVSPGVAGEAFEALVERVRDRRPDADILGVRVEQQVDVGDGVETIVGVTRDQQFGPVVLFGLGGVFVEVFEDVAVRVAPVSEREAREMTEEIDAAAMLRGARGREPVDLEAVVEAIGRLSHFAVAYPRVREFDVNPLLATPDGVTALDFRLVVDGNGFDGGRRRTVTR